MCGEQLTPMILAAVPRGSPPRVRGTGICGYFRRRFAGITPACAGNSLLTPNSTHLLKDHPRVCGEQGAHRHPHPGHEGSPPRVRGTARCNALQSHLSGITPACAGNSVTVCDCQGLEEDHPRVCGEQVCCCGKLNRYRGSPPRVRGTVQLDFAGLNGARITPACAGNRRIGSVCR